MKNLGRLAHKMFFSTTMFLPTVFILVWTASHAQGNEQVGHYHTFDGGQEKTVFGCFELTRNGSTLDMNNEKFDSWFLSGDKVTYLKNNTDCGSVSITIQVSGDGKETVGNNGADCVMFSASPPPSKKMTDENCKMLSRKVAPSPTLVSLVTEVWKGLFDGGTGQGNSRSRGGCDLGAEMQYLSEGWEKIYIPLDNSCGYFSKNGAKAQMQQLDGCGKNAKTVGDPDNKVSVSLSDRGSDKWVILSGFKEMKSPHCYQLNVPSGNGGSPMKIKISVVAVDKIPSDQNDGLKLESNQHFATLAGIGKKQRQ
ncbi:MAG: hypothetical protein BWK78_02505 [Thiotrichaceae bacterium IS1]|nr:MAG: hypothetical protein BWK78_02505 [Thiotrichaceae bacterium IS1]